MDQDPQARIQQRLAERLAAARDQNPEFAAEQDAIVDKANTDVELQRLLGDDAINRVNEILNPDN